MNYPTTQTKLAESIGLNDIQLRRWRRLGMPCEKVSGIVMVYEGEVADWLAANPVRVLKLQREATRDRVWKWVNRQLKGAQ